MTPISKSPLLGDCPEISGIKRLFIRFASKYFMYATIRNNCDRVLVSCVGLQGVISLCPPWTLL